MIGLSAGVAHPLFAEPIGKLGSDIGWSGHILLLVAAG